MPALMQPTDQQQTRHLAVTRCAAPGLQVGGGLGRSPEFSRAFQRHADGFSLIEVLVAVLVLTVGLLGLAALQVTGLKVTESSQLRTQATLAAYDVIDRLRADPASLLSNGTRNMPKATCGPPLAVAGATGALARWYGDFCAFGLPSPVEAANTNAVTIDCQGNACGTGNCEIVIYWDDSRGGNPFYQGGETNATSADRAFRVCTRLPI